MVITYDYSELQLLRSVQPTGRRESKTFDINSIDKVPDTILEGKEVENHRTPLFANSLG